MNRVEGPIGFGIEDKERNSSNRGGDRKSFEYVKKSKGLTASQLV